MAPHKDRRISHSRSLVRDPFRGAGGRTLKCDLLLKNAFIIDGTGSPGYYGSLAVNEDRIAALGKISAESSRTIDLHGLAICPAFIDIHSHADHNILMYPQMSNYLKMGVGTVLTGQCGLSLAPLSDEYLEDAFLFIGSMTEGQELDKWEWRSFGDFIKRMDHSGPSINVLPMVGHGTARIAASGFKDLKLDNDELGKMGTLLYEAMEAGAWGISTGLYYPPSCFSTGDELEVVCKLLKEKGGIYSTHLRSEGETLIESLQEAVGLSEKWNIPVQISHLKASLRSNWGKIQEALQIIGSAKRSGLDVYCDAYPYEASSTTVTCLVPDFALAGGIEGMLAKLGDEMVRGEIEDLLSRKEDNNPLWEIGFENILVTSCEKMPACAGKTLSEICGGGTYENNIPLFIDWLLKVEGAANVVLFELSPENVELVLGARDTIVASDSFIVGDGAKGSFHPRCYGTFPHFISKYLLQKKIMGLEEGIRKISGLPAERIGLIDRGTIMEGKKADLVVLDLGKINGGSTFQDPAHYPDGVVHLIINGELVIEDACFTGKRPGRVIPRDRKRSPGYC